jgi:putative oxidoreductase
MSSVTIASGASEAQGSAVSAETLALVVGRLLLGVFFALGGFHHFSALDPISQAIARRGVPAPKLVLIVGSVFQIVAGLLLAAGVYVQAAALGLVAFTLIASIMLVNFWDLEGAAREAAVTNWKSNLAIIGGLLIAAGTAGG